eukprot:3635196-Rhodomonas_salina.1
MVPGKHVLEVLLRDRLQVSTYAATTVGIQYEPAEQYGKEGKFLGRALGDMARYGISLREWFAMPGTDEENGGTSAMVPCPASQVPQLLTYAYRPIHISLPMCTDLRESPYACAAY